MSVTPIPLASRPAAFTLVEVTLALGIAVFCLLVVFGLLNVGVSTSTASFEQTVATNTLSSVAADLRSATRDGTQVTTAFYGLHVPKSGGAASTMVATDTLYLDASGQYRDASKVPFTATTIGVRYRLNVSMKPGNDRQATLAWLTVSWPAAAANPAGAVETLVALDRN